MNDSDLITLTIDGRKVSVPKGTPVIEAARQLGIEIPFFCYHPRLSMENGANCRMCLVEVGTPRKNPDGSETVAFMPKPQTACSLPVSEGMVVRTESPQITRDRKGVLEFLLINHPLDCPICDRGGECPLQNNTLHYGPPISRFVEEKRHLPKAYPLSDYVVFDRERCIHCARCTRFTQDISGDAQLDFLFRGADTQVGTFAETTFTSRFSGNVIELCPVGALLSRSYRFKARPWDLMTQKSICTQCSNGCNIKLDHRASELQRVNARVNEAVNEEWTCDRGKFGMDYVSSPDRLKWPLVRKDGKFVRATWEDALRLVAERLRAAAPRVAAIGGAQAPNEDLYVWQRLFRETLGSANLDHRMGPNFAPTQEGLYARLGYHTMGNSIADFERMRAILVLGSNLLDEQPILYLRVRKAWRFRGAQVVEAVPAGGEEPDAPEHVAAFAAVSLRYRPGTEAALLRGMLRAMLDEGLLPQSTGLLTGASALPEVAAAASQAEVTEESLRRAARICAAGEMAILAGEAIRNHAHQEDVLDALRDLATATGNAGNVNLPVTEVNAQGAMDMGILPDVQPGYVPAETVGLNTRQMLEGLAAGALGAVWVLQCDLVNAFHDPSLARRALEAAPFTVVSDLRLTETASMADVVLPIQSVAERDGTYTNCERRVQRFHRAFELSPEIRSGWQAAAQISHLLGRPMAYFSARDVQREIAALVPGYAGCGPRDLGDEGVRWTYPSEPSARDAAVSDTAPSGAEA